MKLTARLSDLLGNERRGIQEFNPVISQLPEHRDTVPIHERNISQIDAHLQTLLQVRLTRLLQKLHPLRADLTVNSYRHCFTRRPDY
ncbi:MAG: hypothetical protein LAO08_00265 [Acidobacteriia bacterium]|nr:hypothetical protein [Terriglobia bacterium]